MRYGKLILVNLCKP